MGMVADCIKQAGLDGADDETKQLQERLTGIDTTLENTPATGEADIARMEAPHAEGGFNLPTARSETMRSALKWLAITGGTAMTAGIALRLLRARSESAQRAKLTKSLGINTGIPGREIHAPVLFRKKGALSSALLGATLAAPAVSQLSGRPIADVAGKAWGQVKDISRKAWAPAGRATDHPLFLPTAVLGTLAAGYFGYHGADKLVSALRERRMKRSLSDARKEFESSLRVQQDQGALAGEAGTKYSSVIDEIVDVMASAHVSGELAEQIDTLVKAGAIDPTQSGRKWWHGQAGAAAGGYLALLALLTATAGGGGYLFAKGREEKRRKSEAMQSLMQRRRLATPPLVTVEATPSDA